ncbi:hypothetical protein [Aeromonas caviae]|uniref:hypothetical protein n=1 Tax=Aeromonas caviae TaxID=648 RepID=UPI003F74864B
MAILAAEHSASRLLTARFITPFSILATDRSDSAISPGVWRHYLQQQGFKIGAILGPKNAELMGLGPKWGHKKSYEKLRLADGERT